LSLSALELDLMFCLTACSLLIASMDVVAPMQ
jgi:hypothetical protein